MAGERKWARAILSVFVWDMVKVVCKWFAGKSNATAIPSYALVSDCMILFVN
jgi:hypothetical protein